MYRPPSRPPRGAWARFLHAKRQERGWSQQHAFEKLREGLHLGPKSRATYVALDYGDRQPRDDEAAFLVKFFGAAPSDEPLEPTTDRDALVAALAAQTDAINRLVDRLDENQSQQAAWQEALVAGLGALVQQAIERSGDPAPATLEGARQ